MGCAAPKRPSSSSVHRKREFGGGDPPTAGGGSSSGGATSWPSAGGEGSAVAAPRAGSDAKSHVPPPGAGMRTQRKLTLTGRRSTRKRMPSSRGGSPTGSVAARWRSRRALGPSPRSSRAPSASPSLTSNSASIAGLAATIRADGYAIASRALSPSQSGGASRGSKVTAFSCGWTAASGAGGGGEWVKVGARK